MTDDTKAPDLNALREAVTPADVEWMHRFINCVPFGADCPAEDMERAHAIVNALAAGEVQPCKCKELEEALRLAEERLAAYIGAREFDHGCMCNQCTAAITKRLNDADMLVTAARERSKP